MFAIFKKLRWFHKDYKLNRFIAIFFITLSYGTMLLPPWMLGFIADGIKDGSIDLQTFSKYIILLFVLVIMLYVMNYIWMYFLFKGSDDIGKASRRIVIEKILKQGPVFFEKNSTGSIMAKATNDVRALQDFSGFGIMSLIDATVYPIAVITLMIITISFKLTIAAVIPLIFVVLTTRKVGNKIYELFSIVLKSFDKLNETVLENVSGTRVVRAFVKEDIEAKRFSEITDEYYKNNMIQVKYDALIPAITRFFPGLSYTITLSYGAYLIKIGEITIGNLISFVIFLSTLVWPTFALGIYINISEQASAAMDRIYEILDYKEEIVEKPNTINYEGKSDIIFKDFSFKYPLAKSETLTDINLDIKNGETLGVVGKIGSGKTTFLKQFLRLYPNEENSIFLGEIPVENIDSKSIREKIGYVPQQNILFSRTIKENILFSKPEAKDEELEESIIAADFKKDLEHLPKGLETLVGEKGIALSGGQKQRISIARALLKDPEILILDDSLSAVDANTEENIIKNIKENREGKTTIIAAHRLSGLMHADNIIVFDDGKIIERGSHDELIQKGGWYKEQFLIQQLEEEHGKN